MPTYVILVKWTDQGRREVANVADRSAEATQAAEQAGVKVVTQLVTMGRYDQVVVTEAPDDETMAKVLLRIAGNGTAVTEALRGFTTDEVRSLL